MKKTVCVFLYLILFLISSLALTVSAKALTVSAKRDYDYKKLLLLGDSITYGYGLDGGRDGCLSYGNQLKSHLNISNTNFKNAAVNGDTSADLLALLPTLAGDVAGADLIVISIGGNDLLHILYNAAEAVFGPGWTFDNITGSMNSPEQIVKFVQYITPGVITNVMLNYTTNLTQIVSFIRGENPEAKVIFLAQYDPMSGAGFPEEINAVSSSAIMLLNAAMSSVVTAGNCTMLDIYTPFEGKALEWTNIGIRDIHPNQVGHDMIYQFISEHLETDSQSNETEPENPDNITTYETEPAKPQTDSTTVKSEGVTTVPEGENENDNNDEENKKPAKGRGCGSHISHPSISLIFCAVCVAVFVIRRKTRVV